MLDRPSFSCDYMEGAHPEIIRRLAETNLLQTPGYGFDDICDSAKAKIRTACAAPDADVYFLVGGTQTNAVMIDAFLHSYQGVIAAESGHVAVHEAGAIEHSGHKVLTLPQKNGKINAGQIKSLLTKFYADATWEHMVEPGMVYLSQPTEFGTLYSREELCAISAVCREYGIPLYVDGARLAYALACPENDVTLHDMAELCDAFYIGGTKCGALLGEAVVIPQHNRLPHLFTIIKQHGALLAKGRAAGIQFDTLFTDGLYESIGKKAIEQADRIRAALRDGGYESCFGSPTNQVFCVVDESEHARLAEKVDFGFWEALDEHRTIIRFATSWATTDENTDLLCTLLRARRA